MRKSIVNYLLFSITLFFVGCKFIQSDGLFTSADRYKEFRTYDQNFGSRIEQYLKLAKQELLENFDKKKYLMIREQQQPQVIHPRKDLSLRGLISTAHEAGNLTDDQKNEYLEKCDELYLIWEKQWQKARKKAKHLGLDR
jgi:hypothetical protein